MTIKISTATVFHGGRRRWFSLGAACRAEACAIVNRFCDCEPWDGDHVTPPVVCALHRDPARRERLVNWLAARVRRQRSIEPVAAPAPEQRALAACRELAAATGEVKRISKVIGDNLSACPMMKDPIEFNERGPATHLSQAYASENVENDSGYGMHKEWMEPSDALEIISACPHCLAAHNAIQERKVARRRLGAARRAVTMIGRAP